MVECLGFSEAALGPRSHLRGFGIRPIANVDDGEVVEIVGYEQHGERKVHKLPDPALPTQKEIDEHNLTHLPYRS